MNIHHNSTIGIDISKQTFDAAILFGDGKLKHKKFSNHPSKFPEFLLWIQKNNATSSHSCMEATGVYGALLAEYLFDQGIPISVVNPARTKGFSQSELSRTKNDKSDALLIARFSAAMKPSLWAPEPINVRQLKAMTRRLDALAEMKQQELNRLDVADIVVQPDIKHHIKQLTKGIEKLQQDILSHIDKDPCLKNQKNLLLSIPGIGEKTISKLLSYFSSVERFDNAKKMASFCGIAPREFQSGSSVNRRGSMSKIGSSSLRKALFFPAMVALKHNPTLINLNKRMTKQGKPKMVIIGAAMRKLIHIIYGVLKNNQPFQPIVAINA
jgi:transposase